MNANRYHGSLGENIKVHFAGSDGDESAYAALTDAGIKYRLYSCYNYIKKGEIPVLPDNNVIKLQQSTNKHVIQDSGLFTLMFGAGKNIELKQDDLEEWMKRMCKFVLINHLSCTCVEVDCQKLLGCDVAWKLRRKMKDLIPNRIINVFHYEDGKDGLDQLIDFSDYIAISVPELRIVKPRQYKTYVHQVAKYIKQKKSGIDIHLLGCTEKEMLKQNAFCTSADSSSWLQGVRYGRLEGRHIANVKKEVFNCHLERVKQIMDRMNFSYSSTNKLKTSTEMSLCATICKQKYEQSAGNQD